MKRQPYMKQIYLENTTKHVDTNSFNEFVQSFNMLLYFPDVLNAAFLLEDLEYFIVNTTCGKIEVQQMINELRNEFKLI